MIYIKAPIPVKSNFRWCRVESIEARKQLTNVLKSRNLTQPTLPLPKVHVCPECGFKRSKRSTVDEHMFQEHGIVFSFIFSLF